VAVALAGRYASLHLAPDRYHTSSSPLSFSQAGCPSCRPTNSVKALKAGFTSHSTQNRSFPKRFHKPSSWLGMKKTKPNTTKASIHQSKELYYNTKKLMPGLVAFYDIQPGNAAGLFSKEKINKGTDK